MTSDSTASCGVCGTNLLGTLPMDDALLEQSELEGTAESSTYLMRIAREQSKREVTKTFVGLVVGLCLFAGGCFLTFRRVLIGSLVFIAGLFTIAVSLVGGLGGGLASHDWTMERCRQDIRRYGGKA